MKKRQEAQRAAVEEKKKQREEEREKKRVQKLEEKVSTKDCERISFLWPVAVCLTFMCVC